MRFAELRWRLVTNQPKKLLGPYLGEYYYSQKMDGWHVIWNRGKLTTRGGKPIHAPESFLKYLPPGTPLAGELVIKDQLAPSVAKLKKKDAPEWKDARLYVFDCPVPGVPFSKRYQRYRSAVRAACQKFKRKCPIRIVMQKQFTSIKKFLKDFRRITSCTGEYKKKICLGEGVVFSRTDGLYYPGERVGKDVRFKIKKRQDSEARVVSYTKKGTLRVSWNDVLFTLAIGLTASQKQDPHRFFPVGSLVKFSYRKVSRHNIPIEARILGCRHMDTL